MSRQIEGKVAAIIDDTTLVLNVGAEQGVIEGMAFAVFATHGQIQDPDSGEELGLWEMVKVRVVATHVQPRLCTVRAPVVGEAATVSDTRPLSTMMVEHSVVSAKGQNQWQHLQVREADIGGRRQNGTIAVGDGARSLVQSSEQRSEFAHAAQAEEDGETGDAHPA